MNKFFSYIAIACFAIGCGAGYEADPGDSDGASVDGAGELGSVQEPISIGTNYGWSTAASHLACATPGTSGQACKVTGSVGTDVTWCFENTFTAQEKTAIRKGISDLDAQIVLNFTEVIPANPCEMQLFSASVNSSTVALVDNYTSFIPNGGNALTSAAGVSHVNGSWSSFTGAVVNMQMQKFASQFPGFTTPIEQAACHMASLFAGLGTTTDGGPIGASCSNRTLSIFYPINPNDGKFHLSTGEVCRANARNSASPAAVQWTTSCGS